MGSSAMYSLKAADWPGMYLVWCARWFVTQNYLRSLPQKLSRKGQHHAIHYMAMCAESVGKPRVYTSFLIRSFPIKENLQCLCSSSNKEKLLSSNHSSNIWASLLRCSHCYICINSRFSQWSSHLPAVIHRTVIEPHHLLGHNKTWPGDLANPALLQAKYVFHHHISSHLERAVLSGFCKVWNIGSHQSIDT